MSVMSRHPWVLIAVGSLGCRNVVGVDEKVFDPPAECAQSCPTGLADCNCDATDGCETLLLGDAEHCGVCGRSCRGQTCQSGMCDPEVIVPTMIQGPIYQLAVDDERVYWPVMAVPKAGGAPEVLAPGAAEKSGIAVTSEHVYWLELFEGGVRRVPLGGGTPELVAQSVAFLNQAAADEDALYLTSHGGEGFVAKAPLAAGVELQIVVDGRGGGALAVDETAVFWIGNGVNRAAKDGSAYVQLVAEDADQLALGGEWLFHTLVDGSVGRVPKEGGEPETIASAQGLLGNQCADDTRVYWVSYGKGQIVGAAHDGTNQRPIAAGVVPEVDVPGSSVGIMTCDEEYVYWIGAGNRLLRTPK